MEAAARWRNKGELGKENQEKYTTTRASPGGNVRRQIDYIKTSAKYRNMARKLQRSIYWHANMNQNQQHRVQKMKLYNNAAKKYKQPIPAETGARLQYDIKELRLRPEKISQSYQEQGQERETKISQEARRGWEEWEDYQKTLGGLLGKTYPLRKKSTTAQEPEWTLKLEERGTHKEIDELDYAHKKRSDQQPEIARREQTMRRQQRHHQKLEIILAWRDASRYLKGNPREIHCASHHVIDLGRPQKTYRFERRIPLRQSYPGIYRLGRRKTFSRKLIHIGQIHTD